MWGRQGGSVTMTRIVAGILGRLALIALVFSAPAAFGQEADETQLRRKQAEQFREMFNDPDNLDLMYAYARTSVQLRDYEAAISTLERILIYRPDAPEVELELGAAYYRIGSYTIARFYFEEAKADPEAQEGLIARAEAFLAEIDNRTQTSAIVGQVSINTIATTNANNGPSTRLIDFAGLTVRLDGPNVTAQSDVGASFGVSATHIYDLGRTSEDSWRTNFSAFSVRYDSTKAGASDVLILRTGPQLSLTEDRHGPKLRPYAEFDHVRSSLDALYTTIGVGAEFTDTLDAKRSLFADVRLGWRDYHSGGVQELDGLQIRGVGGLNYFHSDALTFRGLALFEYDGAETRSQRAVELGLVGGLTYSYDSGFDFTDRRWSVAANATLVRREHFETDTVALVRRQDTDLRLSLGHTAHFQNGIALTVRADYFKRFSNSRNFRLESFSMNFGLTYFF